MKRIAQYEDVSCELYDLLESLKSPWLYSEPPVDFTMFVRYWNQHRVKGIKTALDLGTGTGRLALPLAEEAHSVVAIDNSGAMLSELEKRTLQLGVTNVSCRLV